MIPYKEKAKGLVEQYMDIICPDGGALSYKQQQWERAKQCALIECQDIINSEPTIPSDVDWDDVGGTHQYYYEAQREEALKYWQQVKTEIELL